MPDPQAPSDRRRALALLTSHPALSELLPTLPGRTLMRLYEAVGIHDAGSLMAATPPGLVAQALDEAAWHEGPAGLVFDADVFVDWLEVWLEAGDDVAAERLAALDEDTLNLAFAELLRVEDSHVTAFYREPDASGEFLDPGADAALFDRFLVSARQEDEWEPAQRALLALWEHDADALLALLERLSVAAAHVSAGGLLHTDAAAAREQQRERQGFVTAESARRFLGMAGAMTVAELMGMPDYDPESGRHLRNLGGGQRDAAAGHAGAAEASSLLYQAGIVDAAVAPRLTGPSGAARLAVEQRLEALAREESALLPQAAAELAYLANVLRAATGGSDDPAADPGTLALATANVGLELLETRGGTVRPGHPPGLIQPFLLAWRLLTELPGELARALDQGFAADAVQARLARRPWLGAELEDSLSDLRKGLAASDFAAAREALGLLSLVFDAGACRAAAHLLTTPPAYPATLDGDEGTLARPFRTRADLERVHGLLAALRHGASPPGAGQAVTPAARSASSSTRSRP